MADLGVGNRRGFHTQAVDDGAFNYNDKLPVECSQKECRAFWIRPQGGVVNQKGPYTFALEPQVDRYTQLDKAMLEARVKVTKSDYTKLSYFKDVVAPTSMLGLVMWESVEVELNGQRFSGASSVGAGYKAWMETLLSYDNQARLTQLASSFMYDDTPGQFGNMQVPMRELELACRAAIRAGELKGPDYPPDLRSVDPEKNDALCRSGVPGEKPDPRFGLDSAAVGDGDGGGALRGAAREEELEDEAMSRGEEVERDFEAGETEEDPEDGGGGGGGDDEYRDATMRTARSDDDDDDDDDDDEEEEEDKGKASTSKGKGGGKGASSSGKRRKAPRGELTDEDEKCLTAAQLLKRRRTMLNEYIATKTAKVARVVRSAGPYNRGFSERFAICAGSVEFDTFSPITHDIFRMNNHLAPGNRLTLILHPAKDTFLLNTYLRSRGFRLQITDLKLHLRTIERRERIVQPVREIYFMSETQLHKQIVAAGSPNVLFRVHQSGVMPKQIVVGFVACKAAEGNYEYNPFHFHHFNCEHIELQINGEQYPSGGLQMDFSGPNALCSRAYRWVAENTGAAASGRGNLISLAHFQAGSFLIPFDLTVDQCNQLHQHQARYGFIDLFVRFSKPLRQPIYVIYETAYPRVVVNDKRNSDLAVLDVEV